MLDSDNIILHVGLHKCASTWLQNGLFSDADAGFTAPWGGMSHIAVTQFVALDPLVFDADAARRTLTRALDPGFDPGDKTVVLSHEALSSRPHHGKYFAPDVAHRLKAVFPNAKIMLIFREQRKILYSLYGEHIRNGFRSTLREFIGTGSEPPGWTAPIELSFFEYDRLIAMYRSVFGVDKVLALPLELLRADPSEFTGRIFSYAGKTPQSVETERVVYQSWSPITTELYRRTNGLVRKNPLGPKHGFSFRAREAFMRRFDRIVPKGATARRKDTMMAMINDRVGYRFDASNTRLSQDLQLDLASLGYSEVRP